MEAMEAGGYGGGGEPGYGKFRGVVEMQSNDPSFPQTEFIPENGYTFIGEQVIFSDALFNGQKKLYLWMLKLILN